MAREILMLSALALGGVFLLGSGAAKWREIAFVKETKWSKSPLPYHMNLSDQLRFLDRTERPQWMLLLGPGTNLSTICESIQPLASLVQAGVLRAVRIGGQTPPRAPQVCIPANQGEKTSSTITDYPRAPGDTVLVLVEDEFVLLDSAQRVVYGARDLRYLARVPDILALFRRGAGDDTLRSASK